MQLEAVRKWGRWHLFLRGPQWPQSQHPPRDSPVFVRQAMDALAHKKSKGGLYDQALAFYCDKPLIMPIYIIVAGVRAGDGGIITRNATAAGTHGLGDYFSLFTKEDHDSAGGGELSCSPQKYTRRAYLTARPNSKRGSLCKQTRIIGLRTVRTPDEAQLSPVWKKLGLRK